MRYPKDHKEQTRRRVVESASRTFRRDGIVASGVVGLMKEAGLTQGGFYTHFASKDQLVEEALELSQRDTLRNLTQNSAAAREAGQDPILGTIDRYLSEMHLDLADQGCTIASLGSEIGRQSDAVRRSSFNVLSDTLEFIAAEMPAASRDLVPALYGLLSGTMQIARMAGTRAEQLAILDAGRRAARRVVGSG